METTYVKPPRTLREVFESLPKGTLAQFISNQIIMSPAPTDLHQKAIDKIYRRLGDYVEKNSLGETRVAPYDVYFDGENVFQPDIVFIANENGHRIQTNGLHGAPDLVIEVLSPDTQRYEKGKKKTVYERNGVKEYWMVNPVDKTTKGFWWVNGGYEALPSEPGKISFRLFDYTLHF